jgi:hypothetical protein
MHYGRRQRTRLRYPGAAAAASASGVATICPSGDNGNMTIAPLVSPCGRASLAWTRESEAAAYLFPGPACNRGLGRTGAQRCRRECVQRGPWVSIAEQLPDRCRREAMDHHRSGPVCNDSAVATGVLTSCTKPIMATTGNCALGLRVREIQTVVGLGNVCTGEKRSLDPTLAVSLSCSDSLLWGCIELAHSRPAQNDSLCPGFVGDRQLTRANPFLHGLK